MKRSLSIIIPVLNDASALAALLASLQAVRDLVEIIVVDGGSTDASGEMAERYAHRVLHTAAGRAMQMQAGAQAATGTWLWFVHADSVLSPSLLAEMQQLPEHVQWGRCDVQFDDARAVFRMIAFFMNWRSRLTGICTGDQGMFVRRELFARIGGFASLPLMEDVELSDRLKKQAGLHCPATPLVTSARRWQAHGVLRTILLMWWLRLQFFVGVPVARLHRRYYGRGAVTGPQGKLSRHQSGAPRT
ncbi:MAG: TIGR04283 family arsenosugar biosynthesis glycosyltransferase [Alcanivoracaceae bacterium]|nr:TIGR04283 family arsenosugar biosynthesis glycosyltransferase [Alcanivoracaceae bacterium]